MVIAMDGPASSGKSTLAVELAKRIGFKFLNTGMIFRAISFLLVRNSINIEDTEQVLKFLDKATIDIEYINNQQLIFVENQNITEFLTSPEIAQYASLYSQKFVIREKVVQIQRVFSEKFNLVIEGRDIGTEVFPNAKYKFFIIASIEERVNRRYNDLINKYPNITKAEIEQSLLERDKNDSTRLISPLRKAEDAIIIDTTGKDIEQSITEILTYIDKEDIK